ncbi:MAG: hypothetical protein M1837_007014 [Sclerophora amabilis]|nr:MAG: hypothetical protein M1837_007014 [Sclerophora amabilis]
MSISSSLTFIKENTPDWINSLDELTSKIASCKVELSELSELNLHRLKPKNGSTESLRPGIHQSDPDNGHELEPSQLLASAAKQQHAQMLRRKRKTASLSTDADQPKFRTRSMIIIRYDSQVQDGFANIYRNIGTARNNLRKARMAEGMAERMKQATALANGDSPLGEDGMAKRLTFTRSARSRAGEEKTIYDLIDKSLEDSQALCEHAAHQSLRDGDCAVEIQNIKKKMGDATRMGEKEMEKLAEKEAQSKRAQELELAKQTQELEAATRDTNETNENILGAEDGLRAETSLQVNLTA